MSEPTWREQPENPNYQWAVVEWKLLHQINGKSYDVEDEFDCEMGTPDLVRAAIKGAVEDNNDDDCKGLVQDLLADLAKLEAQ